MSLTIVTLISLTFCSCWELWTDFPCLLGTELDISLATHCTLYYTRYYVHIILHTYYTRYYVHIVLHTYYTWYYVHIMLHTLQTFISTPFPLERDCTALSLYIRIGFFGISSFCSWTHFLSIANRFPLDNEQYPLR